MLYIISGKVRGVVILELVYIKKTSSKTVLIMNIVHEVNVY